MRTHERFAQVGGWLTALALLGVSLVALASPHSNNRTRESRRVGDRSPTGQQYAYFEAFPSSGAGTSGACSTTAPTGAKGEVLTFTRASNGTCTKTASGGLATTGIANGDLVTLSANVARVEYDSAGTLGLLVEAARTNSTLRSEELNDAVWASNNSGISLPTVTANAATAPDGTATADRLQIPGSSTGGQYSQLYQLTACPAGAAAQIGSYYVRGVSGSGSICYKIGTAVQTCSYVSGSWTRCLPTINAATSTTVAFAVDVTACGANAAGVDAYVWGVQCENSGAYATSYIPTTTVAVTRAKDVGTFNAASTFASWPISWAASINGPGPAAGTTGYAVAMGNAAATYDIAQSNGATTWDCSIGNTVGSTKSVTVSYGQSFRAGCSVTATTLDTTFNGVPSGSPTVHAISPFTVTSGTVQIGDFVAYSPQQFNTIISRICMDPDPTRCR